MNVRRISVMTFNLWVAPLSPANWPQRRVPMLECLQTFTPDILCVQEFHPTFHEVIREALPTHSFIDDNSIGWRYESNIFWNSQIFEKIQHGSIDIGMIEPSQHLFWTLLKFKKPQSSSEENNSKDQLLVSTAHYTWEGHLEECQNDINLRKQQARRTGFALNELKSKWNNPNLPILFMGDLNEHYHPRRILREAGFIDCFTALRLPPPPTHPQRPSQPEEDILCDVTLDWIMHNNYARPILSNVLRNLICTGGHSVSDHCPVMAVYEIGAGPYDSHLIHDFSGKTVAGTL